MRTNLIHCKAYRKCSHGLQEMYGIYLPDFTVPPPMFPPNLNTLCYLFLHDHLDHRLPIEKQMREMSVSRQIYEYTVYVESQSEGRKTQREKYDMTTYNKKP